MTKLIRYLKPFGLSIVLIVGLLFGQAWAELELPAYMQNIVDVGLQNNGIESDVYPVLKDDARLPAVRHAGPGPANRGRVQTCDAKGRDRQAKRGHPRAQNRAGVHAQ